MIPAYLLDSDICVDAVRRRSTSLTETVRRIRPDGLALSVISYGEVTEGVLGSVNRVRDLSRWREFLAGCDILNVTLPIADRWAELRLYLRERRQIIGDNDLLIAATAQHFGMKVVTRNVRHFGRIPGLDVMIPDL